MKRWVLVALVGCQSVPSSTTLSGSATVLDDGTPTRYQLSATNEDGRPGTGTVTFAASAGELDAEQVTLVEGVAVVSLRCPGCFGPLELTAAWKGLSAKKSLVARPRPTTVGTRIGVDEPPVGGGKVAIDASVPDPVPTFGCEWDGGVHPGFTELDGGPLAVGCAGEPIDAVFVSSTSPTKVSVCGTVTLSSPVTSPVYLRALLAGQFRVQGRITQCCGEYRCLRDPSMLRYRVDAEPGGSLVFGAGVRTENFGTSLFGYWNGSASAPITNFALAPPFVFDGTRRDFFVGPGKREGDP